MAGRVLLDVAAYLIEGIAGELDDMEGIEHAGGVLELVINGVLAVPWKGSSVAIWIPERKSSPRSASQFLYTVPDLPGTRSNNLAVGWSSPRMVHDAGEFTGPSSASVLVVPYVLVNPQHLHACEAGGVIRCGLGEAA